jgi:hypothetical protein
MLRRCLALALCGLCAAALVAAPPAPPAPDVWNVTLRYQIFAFRTERLRQYAEMTEALKAAGFERDPDDIVADDEPENPKATRMRGTIPNKGIARLLSQRHIRTLLLYPKGSTLPAKGTRVRVDLLLASGYTPEMQKRLANQTAAALTKGAGFVRAVGYDRRDDTRLVGSVPVENLGLLLEDVRKLPGIEEAAPFRNVSPLRAIFVRPKFAVPAARPAVPKVLPDQEKFTPDLRALIGDAGKADTPTRLEVILGYTPSGDDRTWRETFDLPGVAIEGRLGPIVTILAAPKVTAARLAERSLVVNVRLPRAAQHGREGPRGEVPAKWTPVGASGLANLHALGLRGRGTRIALVADDFQGWEALKNRKEGKGLLPDPVLIDLTAERNASLLPDPYPSAKKDVARGYGTRCAAALLQAAPEAELTLIRIDAAAPYMLQTIAQAINCENVRTVAMEARVKEMDALQTALNNQHNELVEERRRALDDFRLEDPEPAKRRKEYLAKQAAFTKQESELRARQRRYLRLLTALKGLKGVRVVACSLVWPDGYPVDGSSTLSRYFDDRPFRSALWFQAAGDTGGQAWTGPFRDSDGNGVMEFADKDERLPAGSWTRELNFLAWRAGGKVERDLPAGTHVRLTLQWREAHDPYPLRVGDDVYRQPLAKLNMTLYYQPDPDGKTRPADELEVVAQTAGPPQRLNQTLNAATYEHVIDLRLPKAGRYAVSIAGTPPEGIQAEGEATLPAIRKTSELRVRLFANTLAGAGRAVWASYATRMAALGMPADAHKVIAVGAIDARDRIQPSSASGAPFNLALLPKPEVYAYDEAAGTAQAASFAAGLAASSWGSRGTLFGVLEGLHVRPGGVLRIPPISPMK